MTKVIVALAILFMVAAALPAAAGTTFVVSAGCPPGLGVYPGGCGPYVAPPYYYPPVAGYPDFYSPYFYSPYYFDDGSWRLGRGFGWGYRHFEGRDETIQGFTLPGRH
jgi:hypothetical protein